VAFVGFAGEKGMIEILGWVLASLCLWAIVSPKVPTGIVCTLGLGIIGIGGIWATDDSSLAYRNLEIIMIGMVIIGVAFFLRVRFSKDKELFTLNPFHRGKE